MPEGVISLAGLPALLPAPAAATHETHGKGILVVACTLGPLTFGLVGARLWARVAIQRNAGLDDWLLLAAMVPILGVLICVCLGSEVYGFDRHLWDLPLLYVVPQRKITFASNYLTLIASSLIRASILLFYRRLADSTVSRTFYLATWASLVFVFLYTALFAVLGVLGCRPVSAFWDKYNIIKLSQGYHGTCGDEATGVMISTIIGAVQDFITTTMPAVLCWKLHVSFRERMVLTTVFAVGYLISVIAVLRIYVIYRIFWVTYDVTWEAWNVWLLTELELLIAACCASVPALRIFFRHYFTETTVSSGARRRRSSAKISLLRSWVSSKLSLYNSRGSSNNPDTVSGDVQLSSIATVDTVDTVEEVFGKDDAKRQGYSRKDSAIPPHGRYEQV